jgi:hypothetical protein
MVFGQHLEEQIRQEERQSCPFKPNINRNYRLSSARPDFLKSMEQEESKRRVRLKKLKDQYVSAVISPDAWPHGVCF